MPQAGAYGAFPPYTPGPSMNVAGAATSGGTTPDTTLGDQFIATAYDLVAYGPLRSKLLFDQFATVKATNQSTKGTTVQFDFVDDLAEATTPLVEDLDVDSVGLTVSDVSVTIQEYGNSVGRTALLGVGSRIALDPVIAERLGRNAGATVDTLARTALSASTNVIGLGTENLASSHFQEAKEALMSANVEPWSNGLYAAIISPTQARMLMAESDAAGFRYVVANNPGGGNDLYRGVIGEYEGFMVIVNNRLAAAGDGFFLGAECLAKGITTAEGYGPQPVTVVAPVVDKLRRFRHIGWKHMVGYKIFRADAVQKLNTSDTVV